MFQEYLNLLSLFSEDGDGGEDPKKEEPPKEKTYTEDELKEIVQKETDKRVTDAVKTREKKLREELDKERKEHERLAKLSAEEKTEEERKKRESELEERELNLARKERLSETKDTLYEEKIPVTFASLLVADDEDSTKENIKTFKKEWEKGIENAVNERLKRKAPTQGSEGDNLSVTKEQFNKMGYRERLALKQKDPDAYNKLI